MLLVILVTVTVLVHSDKTVNIALLMELSTSRIILVLYNTLSKFIANNIQIGNLLTTCF